MSKWLSEEEFWKEIYKDDPEGYQEHLKRNEELHREFEERDRLEREKVASFFLEPTLNDMNKMFENLSNDDLLMLFGKLKRTSDTVERQYHKNLERTIFSTSKRTFKDVMFDAEWEKVKKALIDFAPDQEPGIEAYERIFYKLKLEIEPNENNEKMTVILRHVTDDGSDYYDVVGMKPKDIQGYALDFSPWNDWLGFYCSQEDLDKHGVNAFVAHVLWEMTFDGFDEETIKERIDEIKQRVDEIDE